MCGNYGGISLRCVVGKLFSEIFLQRLESIAEKVYPQSQSGYRPDRSTIDEVLTLHYLIEKSSEQQMNMYIVFLDFTKAFDSESPSSFPNSVETWLSPKVCKSHQEVIFECSCQTGRWWWTNTIAEWSKDANWRPPCMEYTQLRCYYLPLQPLINTVPRSDSGMMEIFLIWGDWEAKRKSWLSMFEKHSTLTIFQYSVTLPLVYKSFLQLITTWQKKGWACQSTSAKLKQCVLAQSITSLSKVYYYKMSSALSILAASWVKSM